MTFGEFVKKKRTEAGLSLREFCRMTGLDPSNWSKVERGVFPPPKSSRTVRDIAAALILPADSDDWHTLRDLAAIGHIPSELAPWGQESEKLAVFFRMARGKKPAHKDVEEILKLLK
jgi:transcriptional regulator with XRE-family HTH domain